MLKQPTFMCAHCGKPHGGLPMDWAYTLPDAVWVLPAAERAAKVKANADLCQFGERYFIRGVLRVPFRDRDQSFGWGIWVEVTAEVFERYLTIGDQDASQEPRVEGRIANAVLGQAALLGERVLVQFGPSGARPTFHFPAESPHPLAAEQRAGIDAARHHEMLHQVGYL